MKSKVVKFTNFKRLSPNLAAPTAPMLLNLIRFKLNVVLNFLFQTLLLIKEEIILKIFFLI
jgi:hypothetical protein